MRNLAAVELEVAFAGQQQSVIDRLSAVHEFRRAGRELGNADDCALPGADIVIAGDEPSALSGIGSVGIVGRHAIRRPDLTSGDVRAAEPADGGEPFVGLDDGFAVRVVPGDDAPHFHSHDCPSVDDLSRASGYSPGYR